MIKFQFSETLMLRTPLYSFQQYRGINENTILKTPDFQLAIFLASRNFYEELLRKDFSYDALSDKQKMSVRKYLNRASYRSTPFGLFASFSAVRWGDNTENDLTVGSPVVDVKPDYALLFNLWQTFLKHEKPEGVYVVNHSLFHSKIDLRYTKREFGEGQEACFSMVSIDRNAFLKKLLLYCNNGRTFDEIITFIIKETNAEPEPARRFLGELAEEQILLPPTAPNITGADYTSIVLQHLSRHLSLNATAVATKIDTGAEYGKALAEIADGLATLESLSESRSANPFYATSERKVESGQLPIRYQKQLLDGLSCLDRLSSISAHPDLENFKKRFAEKYETGEVPLLEALDPQFGIGYGNLDKILDSTLFTIPVTKTPEPAGSSTSFQDETSVLLREWIAKNAGAGIDELVITDDHLAALSAGNRDSNLAPSLSVIFRPMGEQVYIEQAGGNTALSLLGRFAGSDAIYPLAKEIAEKEQTCNEDVVFAEVAHVCDLHAANINRRPSLVQYEIPVLTTSKLAQDKQIQLADLYVSVKENQIRLYSKRLRKFVIPQLSSAYNYTRNAYPVFRFLCELQKQELKTNLTLSLSTLAPGLQFYPRVTYKSCVLHLAEWHFPAKDLLDAPTETEAVKNFKSLVTKRSLPRYLAYVVHDNFLVIDTTVESEINLLLQEISGKKNIVLREFPFIRANGVFNTKREPLTGQFIAPIYREEKVYRVADPQGTKSCRPSIADTSDWYYVKIYCHPLSSDLILQKHILPLITHWKKEATIEWFWIRYNDPDYHLRLRIRTLPENRADIIGALTSRLNKLIGMKLVRSCETDRYKRETERYSPELIVPVEGIFQESSEIIGAFLKKNKGQNQTDETKISTGVRSVFEMLPSFGFDQQEQIAFCRRQFDRFLSEFDNPKDVKTDIERGYKKLLTQTLAENYRSNSKTYKRLARNITDLVRTASNIQASGVYPEKLAADIIHMHLNRLFTYNQRYWEMVTYYFTYRQLAMTFHKNQQEITGVSI
ncbi:hypothetical protein EPD60_00335 [Flaviaesturariibacter flavus]|uniref:Lantibiotic dehydratase n=1 Tax=Flaviaesturariibacter flavus TaxID=2502780 RepID=A0A4R1BQQ3_9BACT|nr:lantibiotic dehydratase [Flaviaesturariibacter flavus]TCJ19606.1 hypothetical protein EPD60_00335 [Flaviaesturariibacter flavus]